MVDLIIEEDVKEFIKRLPELTVMPPRTHLLMLAVRSRKAKALYDMKMSDIVVERKNIRPDSDWKNRYFNKVRNLAVLQERGFYEIKGHYTVPEMMGIFATLSPRDVIKATADLMKENISFLYQRSESGNAQLMRQDIRFVSKLHVFKSRDTNFVTLDLDVDDKSILNAILDEVSMLPIFMVTETSRGYHVVLNVIKSEDARLFYGMGPESKEKLIHKLTLEYGPKGLEIQRDSQEPVPGTKYYRDNGNLHYVRILR